MQYYVYILANKWNTVLYIGVTNNIARRIYEHKEKLVEGFTKKYNVDKLVYFEETNEAIIAMEREKQLKKWTRKKKKWLIEQKNPNWSDLSNEFL